MLLHADIRMEIDRLSHLPLKNWTPPNIETLQLKNGMQVFLLPDNEIPSVSVKLYLKAGAIFESAEKVGLASLTASLLRLGGAGTYSPEAFDQALEDRAIALSAEAGLEHASINLKALTADFVPALQFMLTMLTQPKFEEGRFQLLKLKFRDQILRQNDYPDKIAHREFKKLLMGKESVWARTATLKSVDAISLADVQHFYQSSYLPNHAYLAIGGNFDVKLLKQELAVWEKNWAKGEEKNNYPPRVEKVFLQNSSYIHKEVDQATIIMGHWGDRRDNPDKFALIVLNYILGGDTLTSRLGMDIRTTQGLAYAIYSSFGLDWDLGQFKIVVQTKGESAEQAIASVQQHLAQLIQPNNITQTELDEAKQSFINSFYASFEPKFNIVSEETRFAFLGYPKNYLQYFIEQVRKVQLSDLEKVAKQYLKPDAIQIMVLGDAKKIQPVIGKYSLREIKLIIE